MTTSLSRLAKPIGLGLYQVAPAQTHATVLKALQVGYRHLDTSPIYANEKEVGEAIKDSGIGRENIFIASKLPSTHWWDVQGCCERSIKALGVEYLDLFMIHWPFGFKKGTRMPKDLKTGSSNIDTSLSISDTWAHLQDLVRRGLVKSIGVSNFSATHLHNLLSQPIPIKPCVNQVEMHPYLPQDSLLSFAKEHGITVTAYCPLGHGRAPRLLKDETIVEMAGKLNMTPAQFLLSWAVTRGTSISSF